MIRRFLVWNFKETLLEIKKKKFIFIAMKKEITA
jgi:hypothetical protein